MMRRFWDEFLKDERKKKRERILLLSLCVPAKAVVVLRVKALRHNHSGW